MSHILSFAIDYMKILEEDDLITLLKLKPVISGGNLHKTYFSAEAIKNAEPTLYNKPVICIMGTHGDFVEHARNQMQKDMQDCVGCIPETNTSEILDEDDKTVQYINAVIWKHYFPKVALKLKDNDTTKISMEISVEKSHKRDDGFLEIDEYKYVGFTLLGNNMQEAIPTANAKIIKYSTSDYDFMVADTNKQLSRFDIPTIIKENAKKALELKQKNPQLINFAKEIINNEKLSFSKINWILNKIQNIKKENNIIFFGGVESKEWCESIVKQFNTEGENEIEKEENNIMLTEIHEKVQLKFGLDSRQVREIFDNAVAGIKYTREDYECRKYWIEAWNEEFVYIEDCEEGKTKGMKYTIVDGIATIDFESAVDVISAGYMPVGTEKTEDNIETNSVNDNETIDYKAKFEEMSIQYAEMCDKYSALEKDSTEKFAVMEDLKKFKADTEKTALEGKANELYSKYNDYISEEEKTDLNVKLFSVDSFDTFKEKVFAIVTPKMEAENEALKKNKNSGESLNTIQFSTMPILEDLKKNENKSSLDKLKEYVNS